MGNRIDDLFAPGTAGRTICDRVAAVVAAMGPVAVRVSKSQLAFRRDRTFAMVWPPGRYIESDVPAVLSIAASARIESTRFKEVVHPAVTSWMHHCELWSPSDVDDEVIGWLRLAYDQAGRDGGEASVPEARL